VKVFGSVKSENVQKVLVFHGETGKITQITCFNKNCLKLFVFQREIEKLKKRLLSRRKLRSNCAKPKPRNLIIGLPNVGTQC